MNISLPAGLYRAIPLPSCFYEQAELRAPLVHGSLWQGLRKGEEEQANGTFAKKEQIKARETWEHG